MSIGEITYLLRDDELYIPTLSKNGDDWSVGQKRAFIESLILGFPASSFILLKNENGTLKVVDGVKRFKAIVDFLNDDFPISPHIDGDEPLINTPSTFSMLEERLKLKVKRMVISLSIHRFESSQYAEIFEKRLHADFEVLASRVTIVDRYISFGSDSYLEGLALISSFNSHLMTKFPERNISIKIQQDGNRIRLIVEGEDGISVEADQILDDFNKHLLRQLHATDSALKDNLTININNKNVVSNSINLRVSTIVEQTNRQISNLIDKLPTEPEIVKQLKQAISESQSISKPEDLRNTSFLDRLASILDQTKNKGTKLYNLAKSSKECSDIIHKISEKVIQLSDML